MEVENWGWGLRINNNPLPQWKKKLFVKYFSHPGGVYYSSVGFSRGSPERKPELLTSLMFERKENAVSFFYSFFFTPGAPELQNGAGSAPLVPGQQQ